MLEKFLYALFGGLLTALAFFVRRRLEQRPAFEQIEKNQKLFDLQKGLNESKITVEDLKSLEESLLGKAHVATRLAEEYSTQASAVLELESSPHLTQIELNQHAAEAYRRAEHRLSQVIDDLRNYLTPSDSASLDRAQELWVSYRDAQANYASGQYEGGSISALVHASTLESVTISRLVELDASLHELRSR